MPECNIQIDSKESDEKIKLKKFVEEYQIKQQEIREKQQDNKYNNISGIRLFFKGNRMFF